MGQRTFVGLGARAGRGRGTAGVLACEFGRRLAARTDSGRDAPRTRRRDACGTLAQPYVGRRIGGRWPSASSRRRLRRCDPGCQVWHRPPTWACAVATQSPTSSRPRSVPPRRRRGRRSRGGQALEIHTQAMKLRAPFRGSNFGGMRSHRTNRPSPAPMTMDTAVTKRPPTPRNTPYDACSTDRTTHLVEARTPWLPFPEGEGWVRENGYLVRLHTNITRLPLFPCRPARAMAACFGSCFRT